MKSNLKLVALLATAFAIGFSVNNFAVSNVPTNFKVAVVDVQKVIDSSKDIAALKAEQKTKITQLTNAVQSAKKTIAAEKDAKKRKALEAEQTKKLNNMKNSIEKNYANKLMNIDKKLTNIMQAQAKAQGYNLVLTKTSVLVGGDDITATIVNLVK